MKISGKKMFFKQLITISIVARAMFFPLAEAFAQTVVDTTQTYRIGEVVVTGSNNATGRNLLPYTVSTIGSAKLEATGQSQLLSAISVQVPSLFVSERNIMGFGVSTGGSGAIKIRGVGGSPTNAVLMMVDGQPQFAGIYSHHVADVYETEYVDHVEVLRGPGSVLYGSNAMGGVINVITKNATENGVHTTLSSQYGSYNTCRSSLSNTTRFGKFSSLISLGYDRTDGLVENFDFKQGSVYAKLGYDFTDVWKTRLDYSLMKFVGNDPVYPKLSNQESTDIYHQNIVRGEVSLAINNNYEQSNGCFRVYYSYGNHNIDDPQHFHSLDNRFGVLAYQNFIPWEGANGTVGFDFDIYSGEIPMSDGNAHVEGSMSTISRKSITEYSPYITFAQDFFDGILILNAGVRMANSDQFSSQWIPQGGFVIHPADGWIVKTSLAKGYRNPSFREMYLYRSANPNLESENMINYETTLGKNFSRYFGMDVTVYYCKGSNLIQTVDMKNVNTGNFTNKGVEITAGSQPFDNFSVRATYSLLNTSLKNLTAAPKNQYYLGIGWQALPKFNINAELRRIDGLFVSEGMDLESYTLINMKFSYKVLESLEIFATLNNITNVSYVINRGYEMPGFNGMFGFNLHF